MNQDTATPLRASDTERERLVETLRAHYETGHLGYAEFTDRMERAYRATYTHELAPLVTDLPNAEQPRAATPAVAGKSAGRTGKSSGMRVLAIVGLVFAALVGLSWIGGFVSSHPLLALLGAVAIVWIAVKRPFGRRERQES